jgi:hypothetical protein
VEDQADNRFHALPVLVVVHSGDSLARPVRLSTNLFSGNEVRLGAAYRRHADSDTVTVVKPICLSTACRDTRPEMERRDTRKTHEVGFGHVE